MNLLCKLQQLSNSFWVGVPNKTSLAGKLIWHNFVWYCGFEPQSVWLRLASVGLISVTFSRMGAFARWSVSCEALHVKSVSLWIWFHLCDKRLQSSYWPRLFRVAWLDQVFFCLIRVSFTKPGDIINVIEIFFTLVGLGNKQGFLSF